MARRAAPMTGNEFISIGIENGFTQVPNSKEVKKEGLMLRRFHNGEPETITYWPESPKKKVRTVLPRHPKYGPGQKFCQPSREELMSMLTEPTGPGSGLRTHTKTGYREKKNDPSRRKRR